jgi:hypothetical protein
MPECEQDETGRDIPRGALLGPMGIITQVFKYSSILPSAIHIHIRPIQPYHFQADLIWCDGTFKLSPYLPFQVPHIITFNEKILILTPVFGTDPDRNRVTWETPSSEAIPTVKSQ